MCHGEVVGVGTLQHEIARPREIVPALVGFDIHRAELPLSDRIVYARQEAPFLLLLADLQPDLDQPDAALNDELLHDRAELQEALVLLGVQKPMTCSTPARLYQLRSKITISPAAGKRSM